MARKIVKGLWYRCKQTHRLFTIGNYYYSPQDGMLNGNTNKPVPVEHKELFASGEVIKIASQRFTDNKR